LIQPVAIAVTSRDPNDVRQKAREILGRREFTKENGFWKKVQGWLQDPLTHLGHLVDRIKALFGGGHGAFAAGAAWIFTFLIVALIVLLVFRFVRTSSVSEKVEVGQEIRQERTSVSLINQAEEYEAKGDWRRAIRMRHAALVAMLIEKGILRRAPGKTASEYATEVASNAPAARESFNAATSLFEWAWYGSRSPHETDVSTFREYADAVNRKVDA
jgi:hypothetical protein